MPTANSIIKSALRKLRVKAANESVSAAEAQDGLEALNEMLEAWTNDDLLQFYRKEVTHSLTSGTKEYTIGSGGDIDTTRPLQITSAFIRDNSDSDWPMEELNQADYSDIYLKELGQAYPRYWYYQPDFPLGKITLWPIPSDNLTLHMYVRTELAQYDDVNENITFPPGYARALRYNLALELASEYGATLSQSNVEIAERTLEGIRDTNNKNIPVLESDLLQFWGRGRGSLSAWGSGGGSGGTSDITEIDEQGDA